jgi:rRNA maturation endonuclease Nob1
MPQNSHKFTDPRRSRGPSKVCDRCKKNPAVRGQKLCKNCGFYAGHAAKNAETHRKQQRGG